MTWVKKHFWAILGCSWAALSLFSWFNYMRIHVAGDPRIAMLGKIGFNLDQIHLLAEITAAVALLFSGIGMYRDRKGQKATVEDLALLLSISALSTSILRV